MKKIKRAYYSKKRATNCLSLVCFLFFVGISVPVYANKVFAEHDTHETQQTGRKITGVVRDDSGEPLVGVTVGVKGDSKLGTFTDIDGTFTITAGESATLFFSYVGFLGKEVKVSTVSSSNTLDIVMLPDDQILDEVVVVGYGVQKKVNLTGSVATISNKQLEARPVTNVSTSLGGLAPGLSVRQSSGMPGDDGATLRIRGTGSFGAGSDPLIIIDGMEGAIDAVNPQDIESISVLKDAASSAIYGSRAANGVILITTKKGSTGKPQISFSGILSIAQPTNKPKFVSDYITYMGYMNEGIENMTAKGETPNYPFKDQDFANWKYANENPNELNEYGYPMYVAYPNTDWWDVVLKNKVSQTYNIGVTGGMDYLKYNMSLGYMNNQGVVDHTGIERYQGRVNLESKIAKFLTVGTQTFFSTTSQSVVNMTNVWNFLRQTTPGIYPEYNGTLGHVVAGGEAQSANNIVQYLTNTEGRKRVNRINTTWFARFDIIQGLSFETKINYSNASTEQNTYPNQRIKRNFATNDATTVGSPADEQSTYQYAKSYRITSDNVLRYNTTINKDHDLGVLIGHNEYYYNTYDFKAVGKGLIDKSIHTLNNTTDPVSVSGTESDYAMRSFFGRLNYAYKSKYLLEANIRRDGSSRFHKDHRWGTFPSVSAGWRVSEEDFVGESFRNIFQNFKVRASYGKLGNNEIKRNNANVNYGYMNNYISNSTSLGGVYSFGGKAVTALTVSQLGNPYLMWEESRVADVGFDATFLNGRASFEFDYYDRKTDKILYQTINPLVMGTKEPSIENLGELYNRGIEVTLGWKDKINDFSYSVGANFSYNVNKVTNYKGAFVESLDGTTYTSNFGTVAGSYSNGYILEGHMMGEYATRTLYKGNGSYFNSDGSVNIKGGPKGGMIRTETDMEWVKAMMAAGYKFNGYSTVSKTGLWYGDLIYSDTNGNGNYGDSTDREFLEASSIPKWNMGINLAAEWRGFDLSMLWQGAFKAKAYNLNAGENSSNIVLGNQFLETIGSDHYFYDPDNPNDSRTNLTGKYPRLKVHGTSISDNNYIMSDFYIESVSYMRLKNLQVGYTLPKNIVSKIGVGNLRVYFTGENLLTITPYKGLDPETQTYMSYPPLKQFAFGVNINF